MSQLYNPPAKNAGRKEDALGGAILGWTTKGRSKGGKSWNLY